MKYEDQYYLLMEPDDENYPNLIPTKSTGQRNFDFEPLVPFSPPVFFQNEKTIEGQHGKNEYPLYPLLMTLTSFITVKIVKKRLTELGLNGMHFHPAVYIVSEDEWHEDYWFLNIYSELDCWDRDKSKFKDIYKDGKMPVHVRKYVLNEGLLDSIKERDRLIFRMGGTSDTPLFVHQRVMDYFEEANITGYRAFKVSDYEFGMEF